MMIYANIYSDALCREMVPCSLLSSQTCGVFAACLYSTTQKLEKLAWRMVDEGMVEGIETYMQRLDWPLG